MFHISAIDLFLTSLSTGSLGRIEAVLIDLIKEVKSGKKERTVISICEADTDLSWHELRKELTEEGISNLDIERYRVEIKTYLKALVEDAQLGEETVEAIDQDVATASALLASDAVALDSVSRPMTSSTDALDDMRRAEASSPIAVTAHEDSRSTPWRASRPHMAVRHGINILIVDDKYVTNCEMHPCISTLTSTCSSHC